MGVLQTCDACGAGPCTTLHFAWTCDDVCSQAGWNCSGLCADDVISTCTESAAATPLQPHAVGTGLSDLEIVLIVTTALSGAVFFVVCLLWFRKRTAPEQKYAPVFSLN